MTHEENYKATLGTLQMKMRNYGEKYPFSRLQKCASQFSKWEEDNLVDWEDVMFDKAAVFFPDGFKASDWDEALEHAFYSNSIPSYAF